MNEPKQRAKSSTGTGQDEHSKCPTCGQPVVSSDANPGSRKDKRGKSGRTSEPRHNRLSVTQRASDDDGDAAGRSVNVAFAFRGGNYAGEARIVRVDPGGLHIGFPWNGGEKFIQIVESEVVK